MKGEIKLLYILDASVYVPLIATFKNHKRD